MILIVDMNCEKDSLGLYEFVLPIASIVRDFADCEIKHYTEVKEIEKYEKIILSGVPLKDNRFVEEKRRFEWIKTCESPILGICAGMQIIAITFGASLIKCQEIGMTRIRTLKDNPLFSGEFKAYELHNYAVKPSKEFEVLAKSRECVQAIKHRGKEVYCVLFHPEVRNREIIRRFCSTR